MRTGKLVAAPVLAMLCVGLFLGASPVAAMGFTSAGIVQGPATVDSYNANMTPASMSFSVLDASQPMTYRITCYRPYLGLCSGLAYGQQILVSGSTYFLGGSFTFAAESLTHL